LTDKDWKKIGIMAIIYFFWGMCFKLNALWGGDYFKTVRGYSDDQWSSLLTICGLSTIVGALTAGILMEKIGRNKTFIIGSGVSIIGYILLGVTGIAAFFPIVYFFMTIVLAWIFVYMTEIFPTKSRGTASGIVVVFARLAYVLGPLLAGYLLATDPQMTQYWIVCGIMMIFALATLLITRPAETIGKSFQELEKSN
jgi:MFS family permease